ncbi:MAG: hypothetical protein LIP11_16705 [Clostridiales bacterium]|nr:hypothetical protein [Clostridiales bacterium]
MKKRRFTAWVLTAAMILTQGLGNANLTLAAESGSEEQAVVAVSEGTENETADGVSSTDTAETESADSSDESASTDGTEAAETVSAETESDTDSSDDGGSVTITAAQTTDTETEADSTEEADTETSADNSAETDTTSGDATDDGADTVDTELSTEEAGESTEAGTEAESESESETAAETEEITIEAEDSDTPEVSNLSNLADSDELLESWLNRLFYGGVSSLSNYGLNFFADDEINYPIYIALRNAISDIAAGNQTSTQITIDLSDYGLSYTTDDLGIEAGSDTTELKALGTEKFQEAVQYSTIAYCLVGDCPYDLYWFDKGTNGYSVSWTYSYNGTIDSDGVVTYTAVTFKSITFKFSVISDYQDSSADDPQYTLDASTVATAQAAAANAQAIVDTYSSLSDAEKLSAYKEEICALVTYNSDAAADDYDLGYGDPWGLVYVFDGDDSTNVVCEGYSKAFQYLCDLGLSDAISYTVSGTMNGDGHMWNIVTLDGGELSRRCDKQRLWLHWTGRRAVPGERG